MDYQLLEIKTDEILNPLNLFNSVGEAVEFFKEGTKEDVEAAIVEFEKVEWFEVCAELKKMI